MKRGVTAPAPPSPRSAGLRLALTGAATLALGLFLLVFVDRVTDRALSFPEIGSKPSLGIQFIAGLPATLGYVIAAAGLYRFLTNRAPGEPSKVIKDVPVLWAVRALLGVGLVLLFFVGAYGITWWMRTR
jgi:hypothetical protein